MSSTSADIAEFVVLWAIVNGAAVVVLAVLSYVSSIWILDGLAALDRRMDKSQNPPSPPVRSTK